MAKKKESRKKNEKISQNEKTAMMAFWIIVIIIAIIISYAIFYSVRNRPNFTFEGLNFYRVNEDAKIVYQTNAGYVHPKTGKVTNYLAFRMNQDPRRLGKFSENFKDAEIIFNKTAYVSLAEPMANCSDSFLALWNLAVLIKMLGSEAKSATFNESTVRANVPYITCENSTENTVLIIKNGAANSITQISENCYELAYKDCDIIKVTERFQINLIEKLMQEGRLIPTKKV